MYGTVKPCKVTMEGYSRNSKFTHTLFHHPSKRQHMQTQYQATHGNKPFTNTFRKKANTSFGQYMHASNRNPIQGPLMRADLGPKQTQSKKTVATHSYRKTDPLLVSYEIQPAPPKLRMPFENTIQYKGQVERQYFLPSDRTIATNNKNYHRQLGMSQQHIRRVRTRQSINSSLEMRSTIQYEQNPKNVQAGTHDDFKYGSRK